MTTDSNATPSTVIDCGEGVAVVMPGHDDNRCTLAWRALGEDAAHPSLGFCLELWLVRDEGVPGFDEWFWRCKADHPEAAPFTVWTDQPWPVDIHEREAAQP